MTTFNSSFDGIPNSSGVTMYTFFSGAVSACMYGVVMSLLSAIRLFNDSAGESVSRYVNR